MQEDQFWKKFIFGSFDLRGVFWELQKIRAFLEKAISGKILADFQSFKDQTLKFLWFWDSFEGVFNENMQKDQFWKKFIFGSFDLRGVFWELQKIHAFSGEGYFWENCS